ncbi:CD3e molecule, epsilon associated protein [Cololabis saira]|uniref:CD3e molecule, epsilon associated protein n=1 Tax=Cololabis saira TaxID=129043 RepID=UPI002AD5137B|nr:CD3e molecule, epsilon associated protein [Cololabis saira]
MPKDISSSSSEDEAESSVAGPVETAKEHREKTTRYKCPADFVTFQHEPCSSTLADSLKNNNSELWLIKAPSNFNPKCLRGMKVPLSGLETLKVPSAAGNGPQIYSLLASALSSPELQLLTSDTQASDRMVFAPAFSGLLNVHECYGDSSADQTPRPIPATPSPSIPQGLKQRFHPFGSKTPTLTCVADDELDGASLGPSSATLRPLVVKQLEDEWRNEAEEEGRKKKKRKKEKRMKMEEAKEDVQVKQEPVDEIQKEVTMEPPLQEVDQSVEKRKKRKKKKDREREEVEEGLEPSEEVKVEQVSVKLEPMDTWCADPAEAAGKKKKKKKNKSQDD